MSNPVAIITGASSGLGLQLASLFIDDGTLVIGVSRNEITDTTLASALGTRFIHVRGDVGDQRISLECFERASTLGTPKILINCAGAGVFGRAGSYSRRDIDDVLSGNLIGTILFCEAAVKAFAQEGGTIVNVMSTAATVGRANEAIYCASKWGARGYTESLRVETKGSNMHVIAIYPGGMQTPFWSSPSASHVNSSTFMDVKEVATVLIDAIRSRETLYISDVFINRS